MTVFSKASIFAAALSVCISSVSVASAALTDEQKARFDTDNDGNVDPGMELIYFRHLAKPHLADYDEDLSGQLEPEEVEKMNADARAVDGSGESVDVRLRIREGKPVPISTTYHEFEGTSGTSIKTKFYLRGKRADIGVNGDPVEALAGASFSYADDVQNNQTSITVNGAAGVLYRKSRVEFPEDYQAGDLAITTYAIGPYIEANGTINTEDTKLTAGVIGQIELFDGSWFDLQLISAAPYYQTDFDGKSSIYGGVVSWQPFNSNLALGTYRRLFGELDFTWLLDGEIDYKYVSNPGTTDLANSSNHLWLGLNGSVEVLPFSDRLKARLYVRGEYAQYYDTASGANAGIGTGKIGYYFDEDKNAGIEFSYTNGRDHDTLKMDESYNAALTLKY